MAGSNTGKTIILEALNMLTTTSQLAKADLADQLGITERTAQRIIKLFCTAHLTCEERPQGACSLGGEFGSKLKAISAHQLEMVACIIWEHQATLDAQDLKGKKSRRADLDKTIREAFKSAMGLNTPSPQRLATAQPEPLPYEITQALKEHRILTLTLHSWDEAKTETFDAEVWGVRHFDGHTYLLLRNPAYPLFRDGDEAHHISESEPYHYDSHFRSFLDLMEARSQDAGEPFWYLREVDLAQIVPESITLTDRRFEIHEPLLELTQKRHGHTQSHLAGGGTPIVFALFGKMGPFFRENPHYLPEQKELRDGSYAQGEFANAMMPLWDVRNNMPELCPMDQEYIIDQIEADLQELKRKTLGRYAPPLWDGELYLSLPYLRKIPWHEMAQERWPLGWAKRYERADALYREIVARSGALGAVLDQLPIYLIDKTIVGVPLAQGFSGLVDLDEYQDDLWLEPSTRWPEAKPTGHAIVIDPLRLHNAARFVHTLYAPVLDATPEKIFETLLVKEVLLQAALYRLRSEQIVGDRAHEHLEEAQAHRAALSLLDENERRITQAVAMQRRSHFNTASNPIEPGDRIGLSQEPCVRLSYLEIKTPQEELSGLEKLDIQAAQARYSAELGRAFERALDEFGTLDVIIQESHHPSSGRIGINIECERLTVAVHISRQIRKELGRTLCDDPQIEGLLSEPESLKAMQQFWSLHISRLKEGCRFIDAHHH